MKTLIEKLEKLKNEISNDDFLPYYYKSGKANGIGEAINIVKEHQGINGSDPYETGLYDGVQDKERHNSNWVSVDERLPSDGDIVEVYRYSYKWGDLVWQCLYTKAHGFRNYPVDGIGKNEKITHWREIQPPSEVQDEN